LTCTIPVAPIATTVAARVWLIHVAAPDPAFIGYEAGPEGVRNQVAVEHRKLHQELQSLAERLRSADVKTTALLLQGPTVGTIITEAGRLSDSLIGAGEITFARLCIAPLEITEH
jgi:hypothetical protein